MVSYTIPFLLYHIPLKHFLQNQASVYHTYLLYRYFYRLFLFIHTAILIGQIDYTTQIQPIFNNHCISWHLAVNGSGALELDSYEYLMQGDSNNGPVVIVITVLS